MLERTADWMREPALYTFKGVTMQEDARTLKKNKKTRDAPVIPTGLKACLPTILLFLTLWLNALHWIRKLKRNAKNPSVFRLYIQAYGTATHKSCQNWHHVLTPLKAAHSLWFHFSNQRQLTSILVAFHLPLHIRQFPVRSTLTAQLQFQCDCT